MELHQVRYFLALCEEHNFTRAAKRCGVSQPSLSNAIKRLEQELGGPLFHRNRVNCRLSELGQAVRPHLAKLDQCAGDARRQAAHFLTGSRVATTALEQAPSIGRTFIDRSSGFIWSIQNNRRKGHNMQKPIYFVGACALAVTAFFVWSQPAPSPLQAATPTTPTISPIEMMINHNKPLPVEQWDAF